MKTLIIDNYDSFTFNLYQLVGTLGGNPTVYRNNKITLEEIKESNYTHVVISPGPGHPDDLAYFGICREVILGLGKSIQLLGVCLGHQGIISSFGGKIVRAKVVKHGKKSVISHTNLGIFKNIANPIEGMRYHSLVGDKEHFPSDELMITAESDDGEIMGVKHKKYPIFGIQFHPESIGTAEGMKILENFLQSRGYVRK